MEEVRGLLEAGVSPEWLDECGIEYKYFSKYVLGELSYEEALKLTTTAIHQFIKRQYTWWRRHDDVHWVKNREESEALVADFIR